MKSNRVVITGGSVISAIGNDWDSMRDNLQKKISGVKYMPEWDQYEDLNTRIAAPVSFEEPKHFTRKKNRSMGKVAKMAVISTEKALIKSGLMNNDIIASLDTGISYGSSTGSTDAVSDFAKMLICKKLEGLSATTYIRMMSHTCAVNLGVFFKAQGRIIPTSSACTSGSQGIGYAYEAIKYGKQKVMIAGGAEELCPTQAAVFDTLYATSIKNDTPELTPKPYDEGRDGLVLGEGAGTLILESLDFALKRGANILAEIVGFGTNSDGNHITQPTFDTMETAMSLALKDADLEPEDIGYVNGHGTATEQGDIAESKATEYVFGNNISLSTLKGHIGHTLGACGAIESFVTVNMLNDGNFIPTLHLENIDPRCGKINYIMDSFRAIDCEYAMSNNFAFGGINTSLIFKRYNS